MELPSQMPMFALAHDDTCTMQQGNLAEVHQSLHEGMHAQQHVLDLWPTLKRLTCYEHESPTKPLTRVH